MFAPRSGALAGADFALAMTLTLTLTLALLLLLLAPTLALATPLRIRPILGGIEATIPCALIPDIPELARGAAAFAPPAGAEPELELELGGLDPPAAAPSSAICRFTASAWPFPVTCPLLAAGPFFAAGPFVPGFSSHAAAAPCNPPALGIGMVDAGSGAAAAGFSAGGCG
eukprot:2873188-Rhodomonas_salina.1